MWQEGMVCMDGRPWDEPACVTDAEGGLSAGRRHGYIPINEWTSG